MDCIQKVLRNSDEWWPLVRENTPKQYRQWLDEYNSLQNKARPDESIIQGLTAIRYLSLPSSGRGSYFRLLKIWLPQSKGRIQCELEQHPVDGAPTYQALSYCWGTEKPTILIICDGIEILVTRTVASALSRLRLRGCQYVWIDSICINQADTAERQQQVQIMQQIYSNACEVCVWLGDDSRLFPFGGYGRIAFRGLRIYSREPGELIHLSRKKRPLAGCDLVSNDANGITELRFALRQILLMPWFDRVWCVQEVLMNSKATLICGANEISWHTFRKGLAAALQTDTVEGHSFRTISRDSLIIRRMDGLAEYELPNSNDNAASYLLRLMIRYRTKQSTDPRDKVYALFGIVKHFFDYFDLVPSYDISVADAYRRVTSYVLRHTGDLNVLAVCDGRPASRQLIAQSWVADWSCFEHLPETFQDLGTNRVFCDPSSKRSTIEASLQCEYKTLKLRGRIFDSVEEVGDVLLLDGFHGGNGERTIGSLLTYLEQNFSSRRDVGRQMAKSGLITAAVQFSRKSYSTVDLMMDVPALVQKLGLSAEGNEEKYTNAEWQDINNIELTDGQWQENFLEKRMKFIAQQAEVCRIWRKISRRRETPGPYANGKGDREAAYWQTLCAGKRCANLTATADMYKKWERALERLQSALDEQLEGWDDEVLRRNKEKRMSRIEAKWNEWQSENKFAERLKYAYNRRFARTAKGYFSLVPASTKKGDFVGVFAGSEVPLVFQEHGEDWLLVGPCYVHGIMHGEAYDEAACKTFTFR